MISKNKVKLIRSLERKKERMAQGLFVGEGPKVVGDLIANGFTPQLLVGTDQFWTHSVWESPGAGTCITVTEEELRKVSFLQHPQEVLGVFEIPRESERTVTDLIASVRSHLFLALDNVQDPGNLGTIIRIADWFGIDAVICSKGSADAYNPKVVQATMGSIARVPTLYIDLDRFLSSLPADVPVYGLVLDGKNLYEAGLTNHGVIVMGNEGNGISDTIKKRLTHRLLIPSYKKDTAESLNVAVATAVACSEFRRKRYE